MEMTGRTVLSVAVALLTGCLAPPVPPDLTPLALAQHRAALRDESREVRAAAAVLLGRLGTAAHEAVPDLAGALEDPCPDVALKAAQALGKIGPAAVGSIPALRKTAASGTPRLRHSALEAIARITEKSPPRK